MLLFGLLTYSLKQFEPRATLVGIQFAFEQMMKGFFCMLIIKFVESWAFDNFG